MSEVLGREAIYLWYSSTLQLRQIFPYWILGMAASPLGMVSPLCM